MVFKVFGGGFCFGWVVITTRWTACPVCHSAILSKGEVSRKKAFLTLSTLFVWHKVNRRLQANSAFASEPPESQSFTFGGRGGGGNQEKNDSV